MRYFFDISDREGETRDLVGAEFPNFAQMRRSAKRTLAQIAADEPFPGDRMELSMLVRDGHGGEILRLRLDIK